LIEILIAIVVLTVGLLGMASITGSIIRGNSYSNRVTTATTLAEDEMQRIKNLGYAGIAAVDTTTTENYASIANYPGYKRVTFIDANSPGAAMKTVTVTVFWNADTGQERSVALSTILSD